jgi:hypothetical protein
MPLAWASAIYAVTKNNRCNKRDDVLVNVIINVVVDDVINDIIL